MDILKILLIIIAVIIIVFIKIKFVNWYSKKRKSDNDEDNRSQ